TQASSPQEVRQRLIDSRIGSGCSPQKAPLTSGTRGAGGCAKPGRAPNPPAANTALSRSVRNLFQTGSLMAVLLCWGPRYILLGAGAVAVDVIGRAREAGAVAADDRFQGFVEPAVIGVGGG